MTYKRVLSIVGSGLLMAGIHAGAAELTCKPGTLGTVAPQPSASTSLYSLDDVRSGLADRIGRALKFTLEIKDTEDFFVSEVAIPDTADLPPAEPGDEPVEERTRLEFIPNPDRQLVKGSVELSLAKLFLTPADLKTTYGAVEKHAKKFDLQSDPLSGQSDLLDYFQRTRNRDRVARFLSGFTVGVGLSERASVDPTLELPPGLDDLIAAEDGMEESVSVTFDPIGLFPTGAEKNAAAAALTSYLKAYKPSSVSLGSLCGTKAACGLAEASTLSGGKKWLAALLPAFQFKTVDQFDFAQHGSSFLRSRLMEESLETFTLTWDLKRVFDRQAEVSEVLSGLAAVEKLSQPAPTIRKLDAATLRAKELFYLKFSADGGVASLSWKLRSKCGDQPVEGAGTSKSTVKKPHVYGLELGTDGVLLGHPESSGICEFEVTVEDAIGRRDQVVCTIGEEAGGKTAAPGATPFGQ